MADRSPSAPARSPSMKLTENRALIFDVYGTLVDWESAIHNAFAPVFPDRARDAILRTYAAVEGKLQTAMPTMPYAAILELAYRELTTQPGVTRTARGSVEGDVSDSVHEEATPSTVAPALSGDDALRFGKSITDWKPFPDTIDALHRLKKHFALVVLSNVDDSSFAGTHAKLCSSDYPGSAYSTVTPESPFSLVLTAQQIGAYKPHPLMLASALRQLSASPDPLLPSNPSVRVDGSEVLVVANSIRHDIIPATAHKLHSVWISRNGVNVIGNERSVAAHHSDREGVTVGGACQCPYTWRYETLGRMADAVEEEKPR